MPYDSDRIYQEEMENNYNRNRQVWENDQNMRSANKQNQQRMREWASPVGNQNKNMKNDLVATRSVRGSAPQNMSSMPDHISNFRKGMATGQNDFTSLTNRIDMFEEPPFNSSTRIGRLAGPIGKLPAIGAMPMPSVIASSLEDDANKEMSAKEKMFRFLTRSAGVDPNYNPDML